MKVSMNDVKRNAVKAAFVIFAVAVGFAIATNLELPTEGQANLLDRTMESEISFA